MSCPRCRRRLQNELQKLVEQHKDVQHAPAAPTLVRLEVRWYGGAARGWWQDASQGRY